VTVVNDREIPRAEALDLVFITLQQAGVAVVETRSTITLRDITEVTRQDVPVIGPDESVLDRPDLGTMAEKVFADRGKLDFLERLLHPKVAAEYLAWREQLAELPEPPAVCVTEVPLLFETGAERRFDKVVVITAPAKLREQRRRVTRDDRDTRLLPDKEKVKRADFAYVNTGTLEELDAWVAGVMRELAS